MFRIGERERVSLEFGHVYNEFRIRRLNASRRAILAAVQVVHGELIFIVRNEIFPPFPSYRYRYVDTMAMLLSIDHRAYPLTRGSRSLFLLRCKDTVRSSLLDKKYVYCIYNSRAIN